MSGSYYTLNSKYNQLKSILAGLPISGSGLTGDLNANNYDILNVNNIDLTTINGLPPAGAENLEQTLTIGDDANGLNIQNLNQLSLSGTSTITDSTGDLVLQPPTNQTIQLGNNLYVDTIGRLGLGGANYGTSGQVLTSNGATAPTWETLATTPTFAGASITETISSNAETTLTGWTSQVATGITIGTPDVFTTPTAGWYSLGFSLEIDKDSGANFETLTFKIKRGGTDYHQLLYENASGVRSNAKCFGGSILIEMIVGQTISMTTQMDFANSYIVSGFVSLVKVD